MDRRPQIINVGHVLVKLKKSASCSPFRKITIKYPSRLDAACTDPGKLYSIKPEDNIYPAGQINFCMITKNTEKARSIFEGLNMKTFVEDIHNRNIK